MESVYIILFFELILLKCILYRMKKYEYLSNLLLLLLWILCFTTNLSSAILKQNYSYYLQADSHYYCIIRLWWCFGALMVACCAFRHILHAWIILTLLFTRVQGLLLDRAQTSAALNIWRNCTVSCHVRLQISEEPKIAPQHGWWHHQHCQVTWL